MRGVKKKRIDKAIRAAEADLFKHIGRLPFRQRLNLAWRIITIRRDK